MKRLRKILFKIYFCLLHKFFPEKFKHEYPDYLRKLGIRIAEDYFAFGDGYIAPSVVFDANDYSLISIGKSTVISSDVVLLTHDYSISKGLKTIDPALHGRFLKPIHIGNNSFIGMRSIILPGTNIGDNVIVGAGSVVRGDIASNVVIAGNPAAVICSIEEFTERHMVKKDFLELS